MRCTQRSSNAARLRRCPSPSPLPYARSRGLRDIQLHTNGWKLVEPGYSEALKQAGLTSTMISLHAHDPETFARVTSTQPEYFERTCDAIDHARAAGLNLIVLHRVVPVHDGRRRRAGGEEHIMTFALCSVPPVGAEPATRVYFSGHPPDAGEAGKGRGRPPR